MTAALRARDALRAAGLSGEGRTGNRAAPARPERITHAQNEVWSCEPYILRINPQPGSTRLQDEGELLAGLPALICAPQPLAWGAASWGEWLVTYKIPGSDLSGAWGGLRPSERRHAPLRSEPGIL